MYSTSVNMQRCCFCFLSLEGLDVLLRKYCEDGHHVVNFDSLKTLLTFLNANWLIFGESTPQLDLQNTKLFDNLFLVKPVKHGAQAAPDILIHPTKCHLNLQVFPQ